MVAVEASKGGRPSLGAGVGNVFVRKVAIARVQDAMESILLDLSLMGVVEVLRSRMRRVMERGRKAGKKVGAVVMMWKRGGGRSCPVGGRALSELVLMGGGVKERCEMHGDMNVGTC